MAAGCRILFTALDDNLQRDVVIKSLKPGIAAHRLLDELTALSNIRSRYVVQILDVIRDDNDEIVGFVEEYLPGNPLTPCPVGCAKDEALKAVYPVAAGIAEVHAHGRVHRDIKPDNMRFDANGQLKLFDFGLAKLQTSPGTKSFYFSPGFTAPEAFQVSPTGLHTFTPAVDVFAFASVGIWLLAGGQLPPQLTLIPPALPISGFAFSIIAPGLPDRWRPYLIGALIRAPPPDRRWRRCATLWPVSCFATATGFSLRMETTSTSLTETDGASRSPGDRTHR
jgi:serine/threonine-protein kinase